MFQLTEVWLKGPDNWSWTNYASYIWMSLPLRFKKVFKKKIRRPKIEVTKSIWNNLIESINYLFRSVKQGEPSFPKFKELTKNCWTKANVHWFSYFFKMTLKATPMLVMHSSSTRQLNLYDLQKDLMDCCLTPSRLIKRPQVAILDYV